MGDIFDAPLSGVAEALRAREVSACELVEEALGRHGRHGERLDAYKHFDEKGARSAALAADAMLADGSAGPLCGIPISVKDLYGVAGMPTFAGTARQLPDRWSEDAWLVGRLRAQGAVFVGKTHTVELAYGAVGINPHWKTPWNPWDAGEHRIPGGSSCGAGVSLWEGSAMVALGSDTGGSIRIPASMTGTVGHKTTGGRWPTDGVVPLSSTLDTVGALTRSVADSAYFFGALDAGWENPLAFLEECEERVESGLRIALPHCTIWGDCQADIGVVLARSLVELEAAGHQVSGVDGSLLDRAEHLYMQGGMPGAECTAFLERDLPGWLDILHPTVGDRLATAPGMTSARYAETVSERNQMIASTGELFDQCDVLALPTAMITPPTVAACRDMETYVSTNAAALRPTCAIGMLGLCSVTVPVGLDEAGMPVGLQMVAPGGADELALAAALVVEQQLGAPADRLGTPPGLA